VEIVSKPGSKVSDKEVLKIEDSMKTLSYESKVFYDQTKKFEFLLLFDIENKLTASLILDKSDKHLYFGQNVSDVAYFMFQGYKVGKDIDVYFWTLIFMMRIDFHFLTYISQMNKKI
jgi:hypothetical protein